MANLMFPPRDKPETPNPSLPEAVGERAAPGSNSEAVKRALAAGVENPSEGTAYILKEFGITVSTSLFLAVKATERKKNWTKNGKPGRKAKQAPDARRSPMLGELSLAPEDDPIE